MSNVLINNLGDIKPSILIGGKTGKFVPNLNMSFHDDEFFINFNRKDKIIKDEIAYELDFKTFLDGIDTDIFYVNENGDLKWDIQFNSKPDKNIFEWELTYSNNIEFFYQGELTQEEIERGDERPSDVIGSYAVYCNNINNKYKTGKLCHIYRPFCYDSNGFTFYAGLKIENNKLTITIPQEYLDKSIYPLFLDPTFGNTTLGASKTAAGTAIQPRGSIYGTHIGLLGEKITSFSFGGRGNLSGDIVELAAYTVTGGDTLVTRLSTGTSFATDTTTGWYHSNTVSISMSTDVYGLAASFSQFSVGTAGRIAYDKGTRYAQRHNALGALPATWVKSTVYNYIYSLYATYEESSTNVIGTASLTQKKQLVSISGASAQPANVTGSLSIIQKKQLVSITGTAEQPPVDKGLIKSISINSDGFSALITVAGLSTGGTYDFGLGDNNDPTNAKIIISLKSVGYNNAGVLGTITRTIYGVPCQYPNTGAMRKLYPNNAYPDEIVSGSDVIIRVALSEFIYNEDTNISATIEASWYTQEGFSSLQSYVVITNNSELTYPPVLGGWATAQCQTIIGTTVHLEFNAFNKFAQNSFPVSCVVFSLTDGVSTLTKTITSMTTSSDSPNGKILVYASDFNVSDFIDNSILTARAICYPWVGNAQSILDTGDGVNIFPTPLYTNLTMRLDKTGKHGYIVVDPINGNDTTGAVYSSQLLAESGNPCLTIATALTKLQAYHNINVGHNDAGGGTILLRSGSYSFSSINGGIMTEWVIITHTSDCAKGDVIFSGATTGSTIPDRFKIYDITYTGSNYFNGAVTKCTYIHNCICNVTGTYSIRLTLYGVFHNNTGIITPAAGISSLCRGNSMTTNHNFTAYILLGNINISPATVPAPASSTPYNDGGVWAYNIFGAGIVSGSIILAATRDIIKGFAIIQNLILRYGDVSQSLIGIGSDSAFNTNNIIMHHNTIVGGRSNTGYNDLKVDTVYHRNWSLKNNIFSSWNNKDDTFAEDPRGFGAWPVGYHVGCSGNMVCRAADVEWYGEFVGINTVRGYSSSIQVPPKYVEDNSADGANTSGGDYHLTEESPCLTIAKEVLLPFDFEGKSRTTNTAPGIYIYGLQYYKSYNLYYRVLM